MRIMVFCLILLLGLTAPGARARGSEIVMNQPAAAPGSAATADGGIPEVTIVGRRWQADTAVQQRVWRVDAPEVPKAIRPPAGEELVLQAHASGAQIYLCGQGADRRYRWMLKGPEARLYDQNGAVIGRHYAGPTWTHNDGSEVRAKIEGQVPSPTSGAVPWLLLDATEHSGHGALSDVTRIQRIHTNGGQPPAASHCTSSKLDARVMRSYTAEYYFYAPR